MMYDVVCSLVIYKNERSQLLDAVNSFLNTKLMVKLILVDNSPTNDLKDLIIDVPKTLLISLLRSNLATEVSLRHRVDCADVSLLINSAFFDILLPKPQFVIIL